MKTALLLEGGAMRGLYTAGILDTLMKLDDISFDTVMGVSAGALFGMNVKSEQIGRALRYNLKYINDKRYMGVYSLLTTGNIMNKEFCFTDVAYKLDPVDFDTFRNSKVIFYAVVTNIETGKAEYIRIDDADKSMEYLRASGSLPFVSKPVEIDGKKYLDGGISDSIPIEKIMEMDFDRVIVILTRPAGYRKKKSGVSFSRLFYGKYPGFADAIDGRYLMYNKQSEFVEKLENDKRIFVFRPSEVVRMKRIEKDTQKLQRMYDLGVSDAVANIDALRSYLRNED